MLAGAALFLLVGGAKLAGGKSECGAHALSGAKSRITPLAIILA